MMNIKPNNNPKIEVKNGPQPKLRKIGASLIRTTDSDETSTSDEDIYQIGFNAWKKKTSVQRSQYKILPENQPKDKPNALDNASDHSDDEEIDILDPDVPGPSSLAAATTNDDDAVLPDNDLSLRSLKDISYTLESDMANDSTVSGVSTTPGSVVLDQSGSGGGLQRKRKSYVPVREKRIATLTDKLSLIKPTHAMDNPHIHGSLNLSQDSINILDSSFCDEAGEIEVKVDVLAKIFRFRMKKVDRMPHLINAIADEFNVSNYVVMLSFNGRSVSLSDTPISLGIGIADILQCNIAESHEEKGNGNNLSQEALVLKLKFLPSVEREAVCLKIGQMETFRSIKIRYLKEKQMDENTQLVFKFDGEKIELDKFPVDYDLENDDCIDVVM